MSATLCSLPTVLLQHICTFLPLEDVLAHVRCSSRRLAAPAALPLRSLFRRRLIPLRHHCHITAYALPECSVPPHLRSFIRSLQYDAHGFYPAQYRALCEVAGMTVTKPMPLASTFSGVEELALLHANVTTHELAFDTVFLPQAVAAPAGSADQTPVVPPAWRLRSLQLTGPHAYVGDSEKDEDRLPVEHARLHRTLLERLLPLHASTLRVLEIRLQACTSGLSLAQRAQQQRDDELLMSGMVRAIVQAQLTGLERLRLEYEQECSFDEEQQRNKCAGHARSDQQRLQALEDPHDDPLIFYNFSHYSAAKARLMSRLFDTLPSLTSLQTAWFHPLLVLPFHSSVPHLQTLHFAGLLTYSSLPPLSRFANVQHLLIDFFVHEEELRREWKGEPQLDDAAGIVGGICSIEEEEAAAARAAEAGATAVPNTHAAPAALSSPDATRSSDVDVSFYLFHALARLTQLRSLQLQSTLQDRNCCRVDWNNFTLLQSLTHLWRLQFSVFLPPTSSGATASGASPAPSLSLSRALDRLCDTLPQLEDVIVNIERMEDAEMGGDVDEEEEGEEEEEAGEDDDDDANAALAAAIHASSIDIAQSSPSAPAPSATVSFASETAAVASISPGIRHHALAPYTPATHRMRRLKKLGIWDGHASACVFDGEEDGGEQIGPPCILTHLAPFLGSYPHLRSVSLIFCHVNQLRPLQLLAHSLVSLCLYFTETSAVAEPATLASDDDGAELVATSDPNISALSSLQNLHWLILHGTGARSACFTAGQLVQLGAVVNALPRLRNWRLEHQPAMTSAVWRSWTRPAEGQRLRFPSLTGLSFKDCTSLGLAGAAEVVEDVAASVRQCAGAGVAASSMDAASASGAPSSLPLPLLPGLVDLNLVHTSSADDDESEGNDTRLRAALAALRLAQSASARHVHVHHSLGRLRDAPAAVADRRSTAW